MLTAPEPLILVYWGAGGSEIAPLQSSSELWVPDDEIWWIEGLASSIAKLPEYSSPVLGPADYILQLDVRQPNGAFWYHVGIEKSIATATTPTVMLKEPRWLHPRTRFSVRTSATLPEDVVLSLHGWGTKYPLSWFPKVPSVESITAGSTTPPPVTVPTFAITLQGTATPQP